MSLIERLDKIIWSCNYDGLQPAIGYEWNIGILAVNNWDCQWLLFGFLPIGIV